MSTITLRPKRETVRRNPDYKTTDALYDFVIGADFYTPGGKRFDVSQIQTLIDEGYTSIRFVVGEHELSWQIDQERPPKPERQFIYCV